jgi:hypothetical protein
LKVTDLRFPKDLALGGALGFDNAFSEIFGKLLRGEKSVADFERRRSGRRIIIGEDAEDRLAGEGKCRGGFPLKGVILPPFSFLAVGLLSFLVLLLFSDRKTSSLEAPGWGRFPNRTERPLMLLPMLLMLDSRRSKDFCDPNDVMANPVSWALQRVAMFSDVSLRLRSRTSRRLCDPRMVEGTGSWLDEPDARWLLVLLPLLLARDEDETLSSSLFRSKVATETASPSRVASSAALEVLWLMSSPISSPWWFKCRGVLCSKNKSSSSTVCKAISTSRSLPSIVSCSKKTRSESVKVLLLIDTFRRRESRVFLEHTETSRDSERIGMGF